MPLIAHTYCADIIEVLANGNLGCLDLRQSLPIAYAHDIEGDLSHATVVAVHPKE